MNAHLKVACLVAGDSIDDMDVLRHGAMSELFAGIRAPSTLGSFLRSFTWGHVRQLDAVARRMLAELARQTPLLPGGEAPVIAATRLRGGSANSARGAASLATEAISAARQAGCSGRLVARIGPAYHSAAVLGAIRSAGAYFSVTVPLQGQGELFTAWRYHAVFTGSPFETIQAEAHHRGHAIIEQVFAGWNDGPLALGALPGQRRLAHPGRHHRQPDPRRRHARVPVPCQGPGRHHPGRPDHRRCPDRPPRPWPHHPAPARRMAPPGRMDEPLRSRLRPATRHSSLTSAPGQRTRMASRAASP